MKYLCAVVILMTETCFCQVNPSTNAVKMEMDKNIFRALLTLHSDNETGLAVLANYERELKKPFTLSLKAGPYISREEIVDEDSWENKLYRFAANTFASGELRYYYNLKRRLRLQKITRNFSAGYLSLEPFVVSKTLWMINRKGEENKPGLAGIYINAGFQKQLKHACYNIYFGTRFPGPVYNHSADVFDIIHAGISIGGVF